MACPAFPSVVPPNEKIFKCFRTLSACRRVFHIQWGRYSSMGLRPPSSIFLRSSPLLPFSRARRPTFESSHLCGERLFLFFHVSNHPPRKLVPFFHLLQRASPSGYWLFFSIEEQSETQFCRFSPNCYGLPRGSCAPSLLPFFLKALLDAHVSSFPRRLGDQRAPVLFGVWPRLLLSLPPSFHYGPFSECHTPFLKFSFGASRSLPTGFFPDRVHRVAQGHARGKLVFVFSGLSCPLPQVLRTWSGSGSPPSEVQR